MENKKAVQAKDGKVHAENMNPLDCRTAFHCYSGDATECLVSELFNMFAEDPKEECLNDLFAEDLKEECLKC